VWQPKVARAALAIAHLKSERWRRDHRHPTADNAIDVVAPVTISSPTLDNSPTRYLVSDGLLPSPNGRLVTAAVASFDGTLTTIRAA